MWPTVWNRVCGPQFHRTSGVASACSARKPKLAMNSSEIRNSWASRLRRAVAVHQAEIGHPRAHSWESVECPRAPGGVPFVMEKRDSAVACSEDEFVALAECELDALPGWIKSAIATPTHAIADRTCRNRIVVHMPPAG
jgi:hypothetical protein